MIKTNNNIFLRLFNHPHFKEIAIIITVVLLAQWQLVYGNYILKWDNLDVYFPWKHYISEAINHGFLPLWNPFMNGGFIQYADPGSWYPVSWLFGIGGYNIWSLHAEFVFHHIWAGIGMYFLIYSLNQQKNASLFLALAFALSGFFTSNAQHLGWLVGASWVPWLAFIYFKMRQQPTILLSMALSCASYFMLSGGYPAITIISFYGMLSWIIIDFISLFIRKRYSVLKKRGLYLFISLALLILLGLVVFVSLYNATLYLNRGTALSMRDGVWSIMVGRFFPKAFMSFIFPLSINAVNFKWGTSACFLDAYVGIVSLLLLTQLNFKNNKRALIFFGLFVLMFLIAVGDPIPLREWLTYLPLMDTFRFPAIFRLWGILFLLLTIAEILALKVLNCRRMVYVAMGFLVLFIFSLVFVNLRLGIYSAFDKILTLGYNGFAQKASIIKFIGINVVHIIFILLLIIGTYYLSVRKKINFKPILLAIGVLDLFIIYQLSFPSMVGHKGEIAPLSKAMLELPSDYQVPDNSVPLKSFNKGFKGRKMPFLWQNVAIYDKVPSLEGNSPYSFIGYKEKYRTGEYSMWEDSTFVFSKSGKQLPTLGVLFPNELTIETHSRITDTIIVQQHYNPGWELSTEDTIFDILKTSNGFISFETNCKCEYRLRFIPKGVVSSFYISLISWVLVVLFGLYRLIVFRK